MKTSMVSFESSTRAPARARLAALLTLHCSLPASAQQPAPAAGGDAAARRQYERVVVTSGRSTVVPTDFDVTRIAITNPEIADAVVVQPREILVDGKKAGTVSLIVWGADQRRQLDIVVEPAITTLEQHLQTLFPGENIAVSVSEEAIILSGQVSSTTVMLRAGEIADGVLLQGEDHQHAAGSRRQREPAGHAAGAIRRGQSARAHRARREPVRQSRAVRRQIDDAAIRGADLRRRETRWNGVQRFSESVLLRPSRKALAASSRRSSRAAGSRAWPNPT